MNNIKGSRDGYWEDSEREIPEDEKLVYKEEHKYAPSNNERVLKMIKDRLDFGQKKYGQDIPLAGEGGRDNLKESLEETLDLVVYIAATIIEEIDKRSNPKGTVSIRDINKQIAQEMKENKKYG